MKAQDILFTIICNPDGDSIINTFTNIERVQYTTYYKGTKNGESVIYSEDEVTKVHEEELDYVLDQILFIDASGEFGYLFTASRKEIMELKDMFHARKDSNDGSESERLVFVFKYSNGGAKVKLIQDQNIRRKSMVPYVI